MVRGRFPSGQHAEVQFLVSGEPGINSDEMVGALNDALRSGLLAILLVTLLVGDDGRFSPSYLD